MRRLFELSLGLLLLGGTVGQAEPAAKCVRIYYDYRPDSLFLQTYGRLHAIFLQNLLGHFPHIQQIVSPIGSYQSGDLEKCAAALYLSDFYDQDIPAAFLEDYVRTTKNVLWSGYNVWQLPTSALRSMWGVQFDRLSTLDATKPDPQGRPGFFRYFDYRGETFEKYGKLDQGNHFHAAYEIGLMKFLDPGAEKNAVAWAKHSGTGEQVPYVLRNRNHWYIADMPFSFMTEDDRYLIFADLLFDVLGEAPLRDPKGKAPALVRFEDVHSQIVDGYLIPMVDVFAKIGIPFSLALIPKFADPLLVFPHAPGQQFEDITDSPRFLNFLRYARERRASIIWHGVSHQYGNKKNPFSGVSGDDFEFWDKNRERPIVEDSSKYVVERLEEGFKLLLAAGSRPAAWEAPHYQASPLDYTVFSQIFHWNVGRAIYFPNRTTQARPLPELLTFDLSGNEYNGQRAAFFSDLKIDYPSTLMPSGQFYPYELWGDVYGQRIIPENVGNVQPFLSNQVLAMRSVDDMLRTMKRNRVLRDSWASLFLHAQLLRTKEENGLAEFPGDTKELERLLNGARALGYEFVDLQTWTKQNLRRKRPTPIEVAPPAPPVGPSPMLDGSEQRLVRRLPSMPRSALDCTLTH